MFHSGEDVLTEIFTKNLDIIFFIYGLAFFVMGISIFAQPLSVRRDSMFELSNIIWILAGFGVTHGLNEWLDMAGIVKGYNSNIWNLIRVLVLTLSFALFFEFGLRLVLLNLKKLKLLEKWVTFALTLFVIVLIFISSQERSIWPRYLLAFPGGVLTASGFLLYYRRNKALLEPLGFRRYFLTAVFSVGIYAILGGIITPKADFFPASLINNASFLNLTGVPVQVFRAICAGFLAWSVWNILIVFDWELKARLLNSEKLAAMGKFASIIGHEFRNQLGAMGISVYFLKTKLQGDDERIGKHLENLQRQLIETNRIIENILVFSKTRIPELKDVDLRAILLNSIAKFQPPDGIKIDTQIDEDLPKIRGDELQLSQVFVNIIANAIQAMEDKGNLTVTAVRDKDFVEVLFTDTGPGVREEDEEKIFEPFFSTKVHGTGLGLAICKEIVEAHGGDIEIESGPGEGTTVIIGLPIRG